MILIRRNPHHKLLPKFLVVLQRQGSRWLKHQRYFSNKKDKDFPKTSDETAARLAKQGRRAVEDSLEWSSSAIAKLGQTEMFQKAKEASLRSLEKGKEVAKEKVKEGFETASQSKLFQNAKESSIRSLENGKEVAKEKLKQGFSAATEKATQTTREAAASAKDKTTSTARNAYNYSKEILPKGAKTAWRTFYWWSLAAIAVYGMATTIPKEIIRQKMESTRESTRDSRLKEVSSEDQQNSMTSKVRKLYGTYVGGEPKEEEPTTIIGRLKGYWNQGK